MQFLRLLLVAAAALIGLGAPAFAQSGAVFVFRYDDESSSFTQSRESASLELSPSLK